MALGITQTHTTQTHRPRRTWASTSACVCCAPTMATKPPRRGDPCSSWAARSGCFWGNVGRGRFFTIRRKNPRCFELAYVDGEHGNIFRPRWPKSLYFRDWMGYEWGYSGIELTSYFLGVFPVDFLKTFSSFNGHFRNRFIGGTNPIYKA